MLLDNTLLATTIEKWDMSHATDSVTQPDHHFLSPPQHLLLSHVLRSLLCPLYHKSTSQASLNQFQLQQHTSLYGSNNSVSLASSASPFSNSSRSSIASPLTSSLDQRHHSIIQRLSKSISTMNLRQSSTLADLAPPTLPLSGPPEDIVLQCCDRVRAIFDIHQQAYENMVDSILEVYEVDTVAQDLDVCHLLLSNHAGYLHLNDFGSQEEYDLWRAGELAALDKLVQLSQLGIPAPSSASSFSKLHANRSEAILILRVMGAQGLTPKDKQSGSNNPYCVVEFMNRVFVSPVHKHTTSPQWEFQIPLVVSDMNSQVVISIWNRPTGIEKGRISQPSSSKEAFLGVCVLSTRHLFEWAQHKEQRTQSLDLGKRSAKSRVSGSLTIAVELAFFGTVSTDRSKHISGNTRQISEVVYRAIPPDPNRYYYELYRLVVEYDFAVCGASSISDLSLTLLHDIAGSWRIRPSFRTLCAYDILSKLYSQGYISAELLYQQGFTKAFHEVVGGKVAITKAESHIFQSCSETLSKLLEYQLCTFFNMIKSTTEDVDCSRKSKHQLEMMTVMISALRTCPLIPGSVENTNVAEYASQLLLQSLTARYHGLLGISNICQDNTDYLPLTLLIDSIRSELGVYNERYDVVLFGSVHVPSLAAKALYGPVSSQLEEFAKTYVAVSPDMSDVFDLYAATRKLQSVCELMDFRLSDQFPVTRWFRSFVKEWLIRSEKSVNEWVKSALDVDKFVRISNTILHSTSIIDIFTSFQQQLDFIRMLDWPNEVELHMFYGRLLQTFVEGIARYTQMTDEKLNAVLMDSRNRQAVKRRITVAQFDKIHIHFKIPNFIKNKAAEDHEIQYRFTPEACVHLSNIQALYPRFCDLLENIPKPHCETSPSTGLFQSSERMLYGEPKYSVRIEIVRGHRLLITRPWITRLSCQVSTAYGRRLGSTCSILQASNPVWNQFIYAHLTGSEIISGIHFFVLHHCPDKPDAQYAVGKVHIEGVQSVMDMSNGLETLVQLGSYGRLLVRIHISSPENILFIKNMVSSRTNASMKQVMKYFVDQLCFDFQERIYLISLKYKTQAFTAFIQKKNPMFFKSRDATEPSHNAINMDELGVDLEPLFEHLNANMEVLTENVDEPLAFEIIGMIWDCVLTTAEGLIVPSLADEAKERKPWDERRMSFFRKFIEAAELFFRSGGEGLPDDAIFTRAYRQLQFIIASYEHSRQILIETYSQCIQTDPKTAPNDIQMDSIKVPIKESDVESQKSALLSNFTPSTHLVAMDAQSDLDWILKLLKMRGGKEIVDSKLRERLLI
ncbi:hypothetical protein BDV3_005617 [Batrachochytrium dendrobatidis]